VLGPILTREFKDQASRQNITICGESDGEADTNIDTYRAKVRIASISHIGGHKFAGNVIIYIPPAFTENALKGVGIWYGRVEPRHVEGIISATVLGGKVIKELFRGGIDGNGDMIRL